VLPRARQRVSKPPGLDRLSGPTAAACRTDRQLIVKTDDRKAVVGAQLPQDKTQRIVGLGDLVAAHAARPVQDKDDLLGRRSPQLRSGLRREEKEEMVLAVALAGEQALQSRPSAGAKNSRNPHLGSRPRLPAHPRRPCQPLVVTWWLDE